MDVSAITILFAQRKRFCGDVDDSENPVQNKIDVCFEDGYYTLKYRNTD